jgi:Glycosyltransferase family 87
VDRAYRNLILPGGLVAIGAWLAFGNTYTGDYPGDAGVAVSALDHGQIGTYLTTHPVMGPFATLFQAPFALLGNGELSAYRWVCLGCVLALVALGRFLFGLAARRGATELGATLIAVLCVLNPITVDAFQAGHPEELLTAALAIGAVVVAGQGHSVRAGLLLGLAVATKQWAVLAILPVLMALPSGRRRAAAVGLGVLAVLTLPALIASPSGFLAAQENAASGGGNATIWSAWYPVSPATVHHVAGGGITLHVIPTTLQPLTHPLVVATFLIVPLAVWAWRGSFGLDPERAIALLALLALLRCLLDPVDNLYYHAPLLLSLLAWDAVRPLGRLPLRGLCGAAVVLLFWRWSDNLGSIDAFNLAYLAVVVGAGALIASHAFGHRAASLQHGRGRILETS